MKERMEQFSGYYGEIVCGSEPTGWYDGYAETIEEASAQLFSALVDDYLTGGPRVILKIRNSFINWDYEYHVSLDKVYAIVSKFQSKSNLKINSRRWRKQPKNKLWYHLKKEYYASLITFESNIDKGDLSWYVI